MMEPLSSQRAKLQARAETVTQQHGVAVLEGGAIDGAELATIQANLSALDAAEAEQTRRQREASARLLAEQKAQRQADLIEWEDKRLKAVIRAETAARDLVQALQSASEASTAAIKLIRLLGVKNSYQLDPVSFQERLSMALSAVFKPMAGVSRRFGRISFANTVSAPSAPWWEGEAAIAKTDIERALKGGA